MVKEITCTNGMKVLVDDEFYPLLMQHNWYINYSGKRPYAITKLKTDQSKIWRCIFMHHLIMGSSAQTDHIDGNPLNNQRNNLRLANRSQNAANARKQVRKTGPTSSKYKGVTFSKQSGKWRAGISKSRKKYNLGEYHNEDEAALAYNAKAAELFGPYAMLNVIHNPGIEGQEGQ